MHQSLPSTDSALLESAVLPHPMQQFHQWYEDAVRAGIPRPDAMILATSTPEGAPSARVVLMKAHDDEGIVFVSHYTSRKGTELAANPRAAIVFHWEGLGRQVRLEGNVSLVAEEESDALFSARPRENQISSAASPQSSVVQLKRLDESYATLEERYEGMPVPRPATWGGYRVRPDYVEFWQHRFARMNDRILYTRSTTEQDRKTHRHAWSIARLAP